MSTVNDSGTQQHPPGKKSTRSPVRYSSARSLILWWAVAFLVLLAALCLCLLLLRRFNIFQAELALTIVIVASVVILLLGLAVTAVIFRRLGLHSRDHAMGLPEGSIRAIIALMLIVIFAVIAVFLISNVDNQSKAAPVTNLTKAQADAFPGEDVFKTIRSGTSSSGAPTYTVILKGDEPASLALSQQLLTTLGTLVVAVASFYFGSQSVLTRGTPGSQPSNDDRGSSAPSTSSAAQPSTTGGSAGPSGQSPGAAPIVPPVASSDPVRQ